MNYCIDEIRDIVKGFVSEKRFSHTIGVEKEAYKLGMIFMPQKAEKSCSPQRWDAAISIACRSSFSGKTVT